MYFQPTYCIYGQVNRNLHVIRYDSTIGWYVWNQEDANDNGTLSTVDSHLQVILKK